MKTKTVVYSAVIAALYAVMVWGLAPLSFGFLQMRAANVLKALAVLRWEFGLGFAMGNFIANQASPFGALDWAIMPVFDFLGVWLAYQLRRHVWLAVLVQSAVIAVGVATFPLGLGAGLPWLLSFASVFASSALVIGAGSVVLLPIVKKVGIR
jgi:uncharacterized membrane protein